MFTKKHLIITTLVTFAATAVVSVAGTCFYLRFNSNDVVAQARSLILDNYVDPLSDEQIDKMNDYAISAMVASLEDPYSYYFDAATFDSYEESTKEEYVGVGITVSYDSEQDQMMVISPTDGSPAQKAGILPGDIVTRVDDMTVTQDSYNDVVDYIRGENAAAGTSVKIFILRDGDEKVFDVVRDVIPVDTVSYKMLDENLGYIRISEFKHSTVGEFSEGLEAIQANGAKGLIIDLRSNPGGYADSVLQMTDMLLPKGVIAYLEDNKGKQQYFYSDANHIDLPMVILVNEGTASASELMAGSTQAYGAAKIVGKKTYGKAVGQTPYMLTKDTAVYLTSARYYTPKGECIDKRGIIPDIEVDLADELKAKLTALEPSQDNQLRTAMETLYDEIEG